MESYPNITDFSHELLCEILKYLPLREILSVAMLCKKMLAAVDMHLRLCKSIDFCQDAICGYMPSAITDDHLLILLKKCPHLETVYGLHPVKIERRRLRKRSALTIPGIIEALSFCFHLKAIETSDLRLFEAIMQHLPFIEIIGHFQNRDGLFPPQASQRLKLQPCPQISSLHLIGVEVPELTAMPQLQHLHLQCVRFTKLQPFRTFLVQNLKSFVMKHCIGPSVPQRYLSLIIALSSSPNLNHLELVRVPLLNGLFQRVVEDSYRHNGFVNLRTLVISGCKGVLEADLGHLMIVSSKNLETLYIQPSLTKDSLFVSLSYAQCMFPRLQNLHLGYIDTLNSSGEWSNDALLSFGLAEVPDTPSSITDSGMKVISELFPRIKTMSVSNCPHLMIMYHWMSPEEDDAWSTLSDLTLQKCHCLQLSSFAVFIAFLANIEVVILNDMFREPPKGCSHVGLSAGTGLGMSSAVVSNQDEHIAVQGHHQDFEHPGDEENEENEREFIDVENEEPHFMVLQRDFFDGEEEEEEADAPVEAHVRVVAVEHLINEEPSSSEDDLYDNSQAMNENKMVNGNEKNLCNNEPSASTNNNSNGPSSILSSGVLNVNATESKYDLKQASKTSVKSVHVQCNTLPADCYQSSNSDLKNIENSSLDSGDMSDDLDKSDDDVKTCVCSKISDFSDGIDYDPHKPSTSKAGRHLDYSVTSDSESDDNYEYGRDTKKFKKSLDKKKFLKAKIENLDTDKLSTETDWYLKSDADDSLPSIENSNHYNKIYDNSLSSQDHFDNFNSSLDEMCKLVKPCMVLVTKLEKEIPFGETSDSSAENSNVTSEYEKYSSSQNEITTLTSYSSLTNECNVFSENSVSEYSSSDVNVKCNSFSNSSSIETPQEVPNFEDSLKHKNEIWAENAENSIGEINSPENEDVPENMCCVFNEKLDDVRCDEMLENCVVGKEMSQDTSRDSDTNSNKVCVISSVAVKTEDSLDNICVYSQDIQENCNHVWEKNTSRDSYAGMESDLCYGSVIKTEDESSHSCGSGSYVTNKDEEIKIFSVEETISKPQCEQCVLPCKSAQTKYVCSSSDSDNSLIKDEVLSLDNCNSNEKLYNDLSLNEDESDHTYPLKDVFKVTTEGKIKESKVHIIDTNCNALSANIRAKHEALDPVTANEEGGTPELSTDIQVSKMQNEESSDTAEEKNFNCYKTEPHETPNCENVMTEKQNYSYPKKSHNESECSNLTIGVRKSVSSSDKYSNIPKNVSKKSVMYDPCQPSTSKDADDYDECSEKISKSAKNPESLSYIKNEISVFHTRKHINSSGSDFPSEGNQNNFTVCNTSEIEGMKSTVKSEYHSDDNSETDFELSPPIAKRLKRTYQDHYEDDTKYIMLVSEESPVIIDPHNGKLHRIPTCCVHLTKIDSNTSNLHPCLEIKTKYHKSNCSEKSHKSNTSNAGLPSVSKQDQFGKLHTVSDVNCSHKCITSNKRMEETHFIKSRKRVKNSGNTIQDRKQDNTGDFKNKNEFSGRCVCKFCTKTGSYFSNISTGCVKEKVNISSSDAAVFMRNQTAEENKRLNLHVECKCYRENINANNLENDNVSSSTEKSTTFPHSRKRIRKKRISTSQKRGKKLQKDPVIKSNHSIKHTRNRSKKIPTVPTVCLISQGTQANSADIRRSVRRIRRATARTRRTVSSLRVSRNSTHSNKISAKMLNKKPVNMNPRPETHDKATSTSDPLLEDDAVQTLQLTSKSLLSFTVVSCGISDIIIDHCSKLFHIEVQACRILKKLHLNHCSAMKRLNISQCPKLSMRTLAPPIMAVDPDSYFLVSYEPCMQGYHPDEGEKAILSRATLGQSVLLCHDFSDISDEGTQAMFKEKLIEWFHYLSKVHAVLKSKSITKTYEISENSEEAFQYFPDLRKIHGKYAYSSSTDFCHTEGRYQLTTNNPVFCEIFETHQLVTGFPSISDCEAHKNISLISSEAREKSLCMENKFIGFYIPITENNQINF